MTVKKQTASTAKVVDEEAADLLKKISKVKRQVKVLRIITNTLYVILVSIIFAVVAINLLANIDEKNREQDKKLKSATSVTEIKNDHIIK